ncbi:histone deacetylase 11 isoform X2 [Anthonomus grandis grandis]|uniref:histone deacetylase 11 isoform X2 n=1 Tax=Anthonomus grandis grandis TaxID=2921223 RepID=UPI002165FD2A|nr:histone deacetylase 11 isoform X2 [Anthonomus grandis grandis]
MNTLYINISKDQLPIIYRKEYNVKFCGLEKLHPFDTRKWENIFKILSDSGMISKKTIVAPKEAEKKHLLLVHKKKYLKSLKCSFKVAKITEVAAFVLVPNCLIEKAYLRPMRFQTGGSVLAGKLALDRGWAINIGGGFHHSSSSKGGGFCVYADITLLINFLFYYFPKQVQKVMILDLDAHQGNGYENDFKDNESVYIMDVYNEWIYPKDARAKQAIKKNVPIDYFMDDENYLRTIKKHFTEALDEFHPDLLVYNAGTDILIGDRLGGLSVSEQCAEFQLLNLYRIQNSRNELESKLKHILRLLIIPPPFYLLNVFI